MVDENPDIHLINVQQIEGWHPSMPNNFFVGQEIEILNANAINIENITEETSYFMRRGTHGGRAQIKMFSRCGKVGTKGWHKGKILDRSPWKVTEEDASILLLSREDSTGLDLSFCTHIFLIDYIKDPAMESQIVSRANRMVSVLDN